MECKHKSLENIHCFKCDKTCTEIIDEHKKLINFWKRESERNKAKFDQIEKRFRKQLKDNMPTT